MSRPAPLDVTVAALDPLRFDDGAPVRAASGITAFGGGWLVVSDDAVHAAHWTPSGIERLRVLPDRAGHALFDDAAGTKRLKPDLEAAVRVDVAGAPAALLLGSGSLAARMQAVLVDERTRTATPAQLAPLHHRVADVLGIDLEHLNLEGACVVGRALRWFQRGNAHLDVASASVDLDLEALLGVVAGRRAADTVAVGAPRIYELPYGLAITDAIALPDGRILASAAAEATTNAIDDGPVTHVAIILLDDAEVVASGRVPDGPEGPEKIEGLALHALAGERTELVAVVDLDDHERASRALRLGVHLPPA